MPDMGQWLPTITAILAAAVAGFFALRANQATIASQRVTELEKRLATSRLEVYKPMIETMGEVFLPAELKTEQEKRRQLDQFMKATKSFLTWVQVYGSDETIRVYHHMMQAAFHDAPNPVNLRLYAQFLLAARRDLGDSSTAIDLVDLLGMRITDIYETLADDLRLSDDEFYRKVGWKPPWPAT
jgi:hypothetical protein